MRRTRSYLWCAGLAGGGGEAVREGGIQCVAENAEGEDCNGEEVAGSEGVAVEEAGKNFVMVFWGRGVSGVW